MGPTGPNSLNYTISHITSPSEFTLEYLSLEYVAFNDGLMDLMFPARASPAAAAKIHADALENDDSVHYQIAKLTNGRIIGFAVWVFPVEDPEQKPKPRIFAPGANLEMMGWWAKTTGEIKERVLGVRKYAVMRMLAVDPGFQKLGVGGRLLEWGIGRCDRDGLECWITASKMGKGLYMKNGWVEIGEVEIDAGDWGGERGVTYLTACMVRQPRPVGKNLVVDEDQS